MKQKVLVFSGVFITSIATACFTLFIIQQRTFPAAFNTEVAHYDAGICYGFALACLVHLICSMMLLQWWLLMLMISWHSRCYSIPRVLFNTVITDQRGKLAATIDLNRRQSMSNQYLNIYALLTKREVKMAGYWPSSLFAFLWTETKSSSIKMRKKNEANVAWHAWL